ncbi:hypothetical protein CFB89_26025 [Burkholderia sp. AU16741]|nr:hypothetical protein CFB89_26025 [Burkholderia sp. AU16741]
MIFPLVTICQGTCNEFTSKILLHVHLMIDWIRNMSSNQLKTLQVVDSVYQNLGTCNQPLHVVFSRPFRQKRQPRQQIGCSLGRSIVVHFDCIKVPVHLLQIA